MIILKKKLKNVKSCYNNDNDMRKGISSHIEKSIGSAVKYYYQYMQECDNLAKRANELIANTHLAEYIIDDISCEYSPSIGLYFVVDIKDRDFPHSIRCLPFFELFNSDIDDITIQDLKRLSL